mgnify:CR=1 FL=1
MIWWCYYEKKKTLVALEPYLWLTPKYPSYDNLHTLSNL